MVPGGDDKLEVKSDRPTLLVVEDEPLILMDLAEVLRGEGFTVIEAAGAEEAKGMFASGAPIDCVLSDLHMPRREDGLEWLNWLGREYPALPIVVASGVPDALGPANKEGANIVAVFEKPYRPQAIVLAIRAWLSRSAASS